MTTDFKTRVPGPDQIVHVREGESYAVMQMDFRELEWIVSHLPHNDGVTARLAALAKEIRETMR